MWRKIGLIAVKDTRETFSDRNLLLIMLLTPLALSTIIGLAFGGATGGEIVFEDIPVALVNLDEGVEQAGQPLNYGDILQGILTGEETGDGDVTDSGTCPLVVEEDATVTDDEQQSLDELFATTLVTDREAARAGVADGTYAAAIVVPAGYSEGFVASIGFDGATFPERIEPLELIVGEGNPIEASIVRSVVTGINTQFERGAVTIAATISELLSRSLSDFSVGAPFLAYSLHGEGTLDFSCAFVLDGDAVQIDRQTVDTEETSNFVQTLIFTGSAQAIYFALFTSFFGVSDVFVEQQRGTLQRMLITPTPRAAILTGKMLGVFLVLFLQILILLGALSAIASLVEGQPLWIWGDNIALLALLLIAMVIATSAVGVMIVGLARTQEQAQAANPIVNSIFGALGGAFGFTVPVTVAAVSPVYWARDAFTTLAAGQSDIWLNLAVLLLGGGLALVVGLWLFNRKVS